MERHAIAVMAAVPAAEAAETGTVSLKHCIMKIKQ